MRVKRYIVETMPDAMQKIRTELGKDAVILSTKEMKIGGFLGMFQKKRIEVIAATESGESAQQSDSKPRQAAYPATVASPAPVARASVPAAYRKSAQIITDERKDQLVHVAAPVRTADSPAVRNQLERQEVSPEELMDTQINVASEEMTGTKLAVSQSAKETAAAGYKDDRLFEEIQQMKAMMSKLASRDHGEQELPEALIEIQHRLTEQGVSSELVEEWISNAFLQWTDEGPIDEEAAVRLVREQILNFLDGRIGSGISDSSRIVYIAGPTGVGKTTTIAKLAADQIFRRQKKVGFITADTYRISAIEQLRTYASILNVPIEVVQSPGDVHRAVQRFQHCDLIFMDTAGRNYLNELFVAELHSLLSRDEQSETYLVLSLTSKSRDMKKITDNFSRYGLDKVIFTKLDETDTCGPMFNLIREYPLELTYLTNGQNVPDDLLTATPELLVQELLGERRQ
ncbi:flagellar biosynthesis protein FlhF [Paenibacillus zeisoli]|uniref:Flagellar biosynthesis protein FlhF n=1 Tax=Paenibacillus zeisoli TaxID=2496267 RepID=A0A3S1B784_9BACL|nr:flagellar biosynthesis protein FlhF [Paenibacillus zeisoli]RUT29728.1 flagellar biosynthesis protein FlhF [Paenibacillus zeisoli]